MDDFRRKKLIDSVGSPLIAIFAGLLVGAIVMLSIGTNPLYAYAQMFSKSFFSPYYFAETMVRSAPIMLSGVAAAVAWRAGYINLGMQGQMCVGGLVAAAMAIYLPMHSWWGMALCFLGGMSAAALTALIPTFLDYKFKASLIITTLMLNYAINNITNYFVAYPMRDTAGDGMAQQSVQIAQSLRFFRFSNKNAMNASVFLAIFVVILMYFVFQKTKFGYESKITGLNKHFALYGGIKSMKTMFMTMALSGALSGFAACVEIFGVRYRYVNSMFSSTGYAWTGLMAMLIAGYNPLLTLVYAIFLAGLNIGGTALQRTVGVPMQIADIIQCSITLFVSVKILYEFKKHRAEKKTVAAITKTGGEA
ncbi:MAG: ABC transporter permease [Spirochaetia bacterium]|nr:ABC transporter permease [Spirochaetia bacterium]